METATPLIYRNIVGIQVCQHRGIHRITRRHTARLTWLKYPYPVNILTLTTTSIFCVVFLELLHCYNWR
ncbi:hypothetical protein PNOK_0095500 [Pyrrhoderma noxium]|uniref:Uncharacterized protein n=1 Tax=Pyrrhoderma noxium TaxID=2282107 RepID=A0A286UWB9_9AGAM|nr:hypothetical protein PNOK_0095500 [Pyrrhoderma noxium]